MTPGETTDIPMKLLLELEVSHASHLAACALPEVDHPKRQSTRQGITLPISEPITVGRFPHLSQKELRHEAMRRTLDMP